MKYTDLDKLSRRLRGRLQLSSELPSETVINSLMSYKDLNSAGYKQSASDQVVDLLLVQDIADKMDAYMDLLLCQVYVVPLKMTSEITVNILSNISEGLILSHLISTHFTGPSGVIATDTSQASMDFRRNSEFLLSQLLAGSGIFFPQSIQPPPNSTHMPESSPLVLPEEIRLSQTERPDLITRNYTAVARRNNYSNVWESYEK